MKLEHILDTYNCIIPYDDMKIKVNRFTYIVTDRGLFAPVHMHDDYEFHYIVRGKGHVTIGETEFDVGEGDIYIANPYVNHSEFSCEGDPMVLYAIECQFEFPEQFRNKIDKFEITTISGILEEVHYQPFHDNGDIIGLLDCIRKENKEEKFGYILLNKIMIMECLVKTVQLIVNDTNSIKIKKTKHRDYSAGMCASSIKNYIDVNITNNIGIEDICKYVFLSEKQINRLFCERFDKTVSQYILDTRLEISKKLLVTTNDNLENIAVNSGFTSYQQMYRVFVRKLGMTPKQYRTRNIITENIRVWKGKYMAKLHLIANAHIDAAWLWRWQESYSEVLATFRSALDRLNEFPELKFTSGSSVYYKWIEETDPKMFEEIKNMVQKGRWSIVGGWYLQPDCNLPDGESFARHSLLGQRYFKEKFGVIAGTGYNVDPFGHCSAIPKILKNSGMDNYVFWRPSPEESDFKETLFNFKSDDGSGVKAFRLPIAYRIDLNCMENFEVIKHMSDEDNMDYMLFCGVGNHGGGPTIQLLKVISELDIKDMEYSTVDEYFADVDIDTLPVICNELQHNARGCYSANTLIKNINRKSEVNLFMAEAFCLMASKLVDFTYPREGLKKGWENTLFNQFHDILCGCSVKDVYTDAQYMFGETMNICEQAMNGAMQRIAWNIDTLNGETLPSYKIDDKSNGRWTMWLHEVLGTPVVVFNPYPWDIKHTVFVHGAATKMTDCDDNEIPFQHVRGLHKNFDDVYQTVFTADVPSMGYAVYRFFTEHDSKAKFESEIKVSDFKMENSKICVEFSTQTGEICKLYDKQKNVYIIDKPCRAVLLDETRCNTWGHDVDELGEEAGEFLQPEFRICEQGVNMASVCITNKCRDTVIKRTYKIMSGCSRIDVDAEIEIYEKHRAVKLAFPTDGSNILAKVPFDVISRQQNRGEEPFGSWFACGSLCVINDSKYAYDTKNNEMRLTILRTTQYADHYCERDEYCEYMDMGVHKFSYAVLPFVSNSMAEREAQVFNGGLKTVFSTFHSGSLPMKMSCMSVDNEDVIVSAVKMSEDGNEGVIRLYEINGKNIDAEISFFGKNIHTSVSGNEIKTLSENGEELNFMEWKKQEGC